MVKKKKYSIAVFLLLNMLAFVAFANNVDILQRRLNRVNSFYAIFTMKVINHKNIILQTSNGELWIKQPNLFNFHIIKPNEIFFISNGKVLWMYNPPIKQVTINWLKNEKNNIFFILIHHTVNWRQYYVKHNKNSFLLIPKFHNSDFKQIKINITNDGTINSFIILSQDNLCTILQLKNQKNILIRDVKFNFIPPNDITLDDQRS